MNELIIRKVYHLIWVMLSMIKELVEFEKALDKVKMTKEQLIQDGFGSSPFLIASLLFMRERFADMLSIILDIQHGMGKHFI